jgi:hypothetical protein
MAEPPFSNKSPFLGHSEDGKRDCSRQRENHPLKEGFREAQKQHLGSWQVIERRLRIW